MHRLPERPVASRIPRRKPHPLFPSGVERDAEAVITEWRVVAGGDYLVVCIFTCAPVTTVRWLPDPSRLKLLKSTSPLVTKKSPARSDLTSGAQSSSKPGSR